MKLCKSIAMREYRPNGAIASVPLFQHPIHHRGQAHGMPSGTAIAPPQLDEFFAVDERPLRAAEFSELGWTEQTVWLRRRD